jgi:hypothetical protein
MHPPKPVFDAFLDWAKRAFQDEVATDFQRAQTFDAYTSNAILRMLKGLSGERLQVLAAALPTSLWVGHPAAESLIGQLPTSDKQATEEFKQAVERLLRENWQEISNLIARKRQPEILAEAQRIKTIGLPIVKEFAAKLGYQAEKIDPEVWRLSASKRWGRISADIGFESPLELTYVIFVYDSKGVPLRQGDHYLGVLGIAPSSWSIANADECRDKVLKACEFVRWHLGEYEEIMDAL